MTMKIKRKAKNKNVKKKPSAKTTKKQGRKANKTSFKKGHKVHSGFQKGQSGNPAGRPKGTKERDLMFEAKAEVEAKKKKSIYRHAFERAFDNDRVLIAILKKLVPDMAYIEADAGQNLADIFALMVGDGK